MSSFEAVIDRMKQEGDLTRNSGTNSLKQINTTLKDILNSIEKNIKLSQTPVSAASISRVPSSPRAESRFQTERTGGILAGLSAAVTAQTIGRLGIGQSGIAQKQRERADDFLGKVTFRETRKNIAEKLFSFSDAKEATEEANEPIVDELKNQTSVIQVLVDTFKKGMDEDKRFREEQEDLAAQDRSDQLKTQGPAGPTAEPKEKDKGIFGTILGMLGSGLGTILGPIIALLTNPAVLALLTGIGAFLAAVKYYEKDILAARDSLVEWAKPFTNWLEKTGEELRNTLGITIDAATGLTEAQQRMMDAATEMDFLSDDWKGKNPYMTKEEREQYSKQLETGQAQITSKRTEEIKRGLSRSEVESALKTEEGKRSGFWNSIIGPGDRIVSGPLAGLTMDQARALLESTELKDTAPSAKPKPVTPVDTTLDDGGEDSRTSEYTIQGMIRKAKQQSGEPALPVQVVPRGIPESSQQLNEGSGQRPIVVNNVSAPTTVDASTNAPTTVNGGGNGGYSAPPARKTQIMYDNFGPSA